MDASSLISELADSDWQFSDSPWQLAGQASSVFSFHKTYPDGLDVVVSLHESDRGYRVWESAEHRLSGPCNTECGVPNSIVAAYQLIRDTCRFRDSDDG